jgi:hypothetical protein
VFTGIWTKLLWFDTWWVNRSVRILLPTVNLRWFYHSCVILDNTYILTKPRSVLQNECHVASSSIIGSLRWNIASWSVCFEHLVLLYLQQFQYFVHEKQSWNHIKILICYLLVSMMCWYSVSWECFPYFVTQLLFFLQQPSIFFSPFGVSISFTFYTAAFFKLKLWYLLRRSTNVTIYLRIPGSSY